MKAREALREADAAFQQVPLPPQVLARMRGRTLAPARSRSAWLAIPVAVAAALLLFAFWPRGSSVEDVQLAATERWAYGRFEITAASTSIIHREHDTVTLRSGDIEVLVAKHAEVVRLTVSHGVIEVVGTRFTVHQHAGGGSVTLHEGVIRFVSAAGTTTLAPGDTLVWPLPPAPVMEPEHVREPDPPPPEPAKLKPAVIAKKKEPAVIRETDAAWLLEEVDTCRSRGEYAEAVRLLDKGLAGLVSGTTRERFSFELGAMLTWQLADARACKHWSSHRAAFPGGRYAREVERAIEKAQCEPR